MIPSVINDGQSTVAPMRSMDLDAVVAIASESFDPAWTRVAFEEELARDWAHLWVVRGESPAVEAFLDFWWVRDEVHVLNLATCPRRRRAGHARRLMETMLAFAKRRQARYVSLEAQERNSAALALYRSLGFERIGIRPSYYRDGVDAVVMLRRLSEPLDYERTAASTITVASSTSKTPAAIPSGRNAFRPNRSATCIPEKHPPTNRTKVVGTMGNDGPSAAYRP